MATVPKETVTTRNKVKGDVLDVILRYQDGYKIVDMNDVKAVSWHRTKVKEKTASGGEPDVPGTVVYDLPHIDPPADTDSATASEETKAGTVCYWTGSTWVCGAKD